MDGDTRDQVFRVRRRAGVLARPRGKKTKAFYNELKRRNVLRAAATYVVMAWLVIQVADVLCDALVAPDWAMKSVLIALALGLPIALIISWYVEVTASVEWETDARPLRTITRNRGRNIDLIIIAVLTILVGVLLVRQPPPCFADHGAEQEQEGAAFVSSGAQWR